MGASILGLTKSDIQQQTEPAVPRYQWKTDVWERELLRASCYKLEAGKKLSYPSIKEHNHTNSWKNWRLLSKEKKMYE